MHAKENQMDIEEWTTQRHGQHGAQDGERIWLFIFKRGDFSYLLFIIQREIVLWKESLSNKSQQFHHYQWNELSLLTLIYAQKCGRVKLVDSPSRYLQIVTVINVTEY